MESSKNRSFTARDIERYHAGEMEPRERHALERAAMDDPFLADALEGYVYTDHASADLQLLRDRLNEKTKDKKRVIFFSRENKWLKIAAAIILLAGAGWLTFRTKDLATSPKTVATQPAATPELSPSTPATSADSAGSTATDNRTVLPESNKKLESKDRKLNTGGENLVVITSPETTSNYVTMDSSLSNRNTYNASTSFNFSTSSPAANNVNIARNNASPFDNGTYNGRAFNPNPPVPSENVISNADLRRRVVNHAADAKDTVSFWNNDLARQQKQEGLFKSTSEGKADSVVNFNVTMKETPLAKDEVVVTSREFAKKAASRPIVVVDTLEPAEGFAGFDDYVVNNLKRPPEEKNKVFKGEVQLSFDVNSAGEPVNIAVIKSLCPSCDEEAIRLLKEGPKWKKKKNKKGKVTIKF